MTNHFELLETKRRHIIYYSPSRIPEKKIVEDDLYKDNNKELKKKYDVIGTNKDGPYRSGETNRIRSTK